MREDFWKYGWYYIALHSEKREEGFIPEINKR